MSLWTAKEIAAATGGTASEDFAIESLSIDTRSLETGALFVPLKDARDGHDFIPGAREAGAGAVLSEYTDEIAPALIVDDTLAALRALAIAARTRSDAVRIAVTGSVGKTSLKEAISTICQGQGKTHKSLKSFNNHWGVPLTLAAMPSGTQYGIFEAGMNHAGELADLSPLIAPDIAVITKIAPAHLAHFKDIDAIAAAKAEIFEGVVDGGAAVLNADDDYFGYLSGMAQKRGLKIVTFGKDQSADVRITSCAVTPGHISADLVIDGAVYALRMGLDGQHWLTNGACAVAAAMAAGIDPQKSIDRLEAFGALPGRGERLSLNIEGKAVTVIDESYNANPESMRAAIAMLENSKGRTLAVLGDMFELGAGELEHHVDLAIPLAAAGVARVIVTGECMRVLRGALPQTMRGPWASGAEHALAALIHELQDGDTVLIKGSNATGLSGLVAQLKKYKKEIAHVV